MNLKYRADIDGLRAIAVLSVVLSHAGISLFHGGYIGVDVFFVISGYLITNIIVHELNTNEFALVKFYERRIRRIYPALFFMILCTIIASAVLYNAENFRGLGKSVVATTFFVSNIHFWTETGYFDDPAQTKPLLHTWSLAVEEQYYIIFPLLMFFITRYFKSKIPQILSFIAISSFVWSIFALQNNAASAFYFAHLRAWELVIGGLLAIKFVSNKAKPIVNKMLSLLGFAMITAPILLYSANTNFPGFAATIPVFGTALIIYSGIENTNGINKLLAAPFLVFIGKISYSIYLWHWPVIILTKYYAIKKLTPLSIAFVLLFIFIISIISWKFIETPFRQRDLFKSKYIFIYAASVMVVTGIVGLTIYIKYDFPTSQELVESDTNKWAVCNFNKSANKKTDEITGCFLGEDNQEPSFVIWGDSHGRVITEGIALSASKKNLSGELVYSSGCAPVLGISRGSEKDQCQSSNSSILDYIKKHPELKTVILVGRWALWAEGNTFSFTDEELHFKFEDVLIEEQNVPSAKLFERGLERTVKNLLDLDRNIVIVSQVPEIGYNVPLSNFIAQRTGRDTNEIIALPLAKYFERNQNVFLVLDKLTENYNIEIINPWKKLCTDTLCLTVSNGQPLYLDDHHLSVFGSKYISQIYDKLFEELENIK